MMEAAPQHSEPDNQWMRQALQWAERGRGWTSPRPSVGCVLVRDGVDIGGGHTQPGDGQPHAEIVALQAARANFPLLGARGATAYVTLEPCSHWGTTPPCCDALIEAGIQRVVVGVTDPNPLVAGRGLGRMQAAGLQVECGILEAECWRTHEEFLHHIVTGTPFVTLKAAVSLDGKVALLSGESRWISGPQSRQYAHRLRHINDALLVGIGTVLVDDPSLTVRLDGPCVQPLVVVLDSRARLPLGARLFHEDAQVLVLVGPEAPHRHRVALEARGATVLEVAAGAAGLEWQAILEALKLRGLCSLLIEGGPAIASSALTAGVVDKVAFFVAPMIMGDGLSATRGFQVPELAVAPRLERVYHQIFGEDVCVSGYLARVQGKSDALGQEPGVDPGTGQS